MYRKPFVRLVLMSTLLLGLAVFILDMLLLGLAIFKLVVWRANALLWVLIIGTVMLVVGLASAWVAVRRVRW